MLASFYSCLGQTGENTYAGQLFLKGIYLENLDILIPWQINFSEIEKYGHPKFSKDPNHNNQTLIKWDSVRIFNGFILNLETSRPSKFLKRNQLSRITGMRSWIDSSTADKLISFFKQTTGYNPVFSKKRKGTFWRWAINGCFVHIYYLKKYGYWLAINRIVRTEQNQY